MDRDVRLVVEQVAQRVPDRDRLEERGRDLVEERLEGVVVVAVDDHDVDVGALQLSRSSDTAEAAAEDQDARASVRHAGALARRRFFFGAPSAPGPRRTRRTSATDHAWNGQPVAA